MATTCKARAKAFDLVERASNPAPSVQAYRQRRRPGVHRLAAAIHAYLGMVETLQAIIRAFRGGPRHTVLDLAEKRLDDAARGWGMV